LVDGVSYEFGLSCSASAAVAVCAGCAEVGGVESLSAFVEGDDVVDVGCLGGAAWSCDLAGVVVAVEDAGADGLPA
jgi:hypothetical protein